MPGLVLGEVDLHLLGEGNHRRLWEILGANVVDGGVQFAVWAPNARAVHVVGDWNGWRATTPMHSTHKARRGSGRRSSPTPPSVSATSSR